MRVRRIFTSVFLCASVCAQTANADTIVLKNGRRISVIKAEERGDQIIGETSEGELTLPKSLVAKVEPGSDSTSAGRASAFSFSAPAASATPANEDVKFDPAEVASLDRAAAGGNSDAALRAVSAHESSARIAAQHGDLETAISEEEKALALARAQPSILLTLAYFHLRRSEYSIALDQIRLARKTDPDSVDAARLAGWADYGLNQIADAVSEWQHAQSLRPDADVAKALERAQRDAQTESDFREGQSNHFVVRYSGKAKPGLARSIVDALEEHYSTIRDALNFTPAEPIGVILYTNQEFADITRAPGWAGAINDGRIRLPVQGVTIVNEQLSKILKHELTHSFIRQKTRGRCPTWLNEGIAQWMEGTQSKLYARALAGQFDAGHVTQLRDLESSWLNLSDNDAAIAYAWSEAVVEEIVNSGGVSDLNRVLDALGSSPSPESAVRTALHMDYSVLAQETAAYLHSF